MPRLLIVEDHRKDARVAGDIAASVGFSDVEICDTLRSAVCHLEHGLNDPLALPDAIIVDLDLGIESGFDLLLFRHNSPRLMQIPMIVWTGLGDENGGVCELFHVTATIYKWEGPDKLREALANLEPQPTP
jgi:CheY-like chemotaxis protein